MPLSLHTGFTSLSKDFKADDESSMFQAIVPYIDHFVNVEVKLDTQKLLYFAEYLENYKWDNLQSLVLVN